MLLLLTCAWRLATAIALLWACLVSAGSWANESGIQPRIENMEEILISGYGQNISDEITVAARIPGGVNVINADDLRQQNQQSFADMLRNVPGIWAASTSGGQNTFYTSRGSNLDATSYDSNGIKLLVDGLPVTTADGNNHNRALDPLSAQSATVARGANAMTFGASTLGGAINFTTPTAQHMEGFRVRLNNGSHGLDAIRLTAAGQQSQFDGLATLEAYSWDGYLQRSAEDRVGLYTNAGWQIDDRISTRFYGTFLDNKQALPGALTRAQIMDNPDMANPSAVSGNFQLNVETARLANRTSWEMDADRRLEFGVSIEQQSLYHPIVDKVMVDFDGPGPMAAVEVFSLLIDTDHQNLGGMFRYHRSLGEHQLVFGVNYGKNSVEGGHYRNDNGMRNGLSNLIDNQAETWELFVEDQWSLTDKIALTLAVQAVVADRETRSIEVAIGNIANPRGSYDSLNPRVGLLANLTENTAIYANVSRLYEPPTNFELEDDVRGSNQPLDAMQGNSFEVGTRGSKSVGDNSLWRWDLALYYAEIKDEILSRDDPSAPGTSLSTNIDQTIHSGIEAQVAGEFGAGSGFTLEPTVSYTLNHFRFDKDPVYGTNTLPAAPEYSLRGELMLRHSSGYHVGPVFDLIGERWADFSNTYKVDSYELLGMRGGYESTDWRVFVDLQNLLDAHYVATHSVRDRAASNAAILHAGLPRSIYLGMELVF